MEEPSKGNILFGPEPGKESQKKYGEAFIQARKEFAENGITHPTGKTPGFRDRIQEIYKNLMGDSYKPVYSDSIKMRLPTDKLPKAEKPIRTIEEIIRQSEIWEKEESIKSLPGKTYGGYTFSLAQMETVVGLPEETCIIIGQTMKKALSAHKNKYQIKQDLFMAVVNWDAEFFVELAFADSYFLEKPLISTFYHEYEFESEEEAKNIINQSEYLKHYPELKEEILKDALDFIRSCNEAAEKYISIRKGKKVRIIEKGTQIPDGWTINEGSLSI